MTLASSLSLGISEPPAKSEPASFECVHLGPDLGACCLAKSRPLVWTAAHSELRSRGLSAFWQVDPQPDFKSSPSRPQHSALGEVSQLLTCPVTPLAKSGPLSKSKASKARVWSCVCDARFGFMKPQASASLGSGLPRKAAPCEKRGAFEPAAFRKGHDTAIAQARKLSCVLPARGLAVN
jgi:hypothetical protein